MPASFPHFMGLTCILCVFMLYSAYKYFICRLSSKLHESEKYKIHSPARYSAHVNLSYDGLFSASYTCNIHNISIHAELPLDSSSHQDPSNGLYHLEILQIIDIICLTVLRWIIEIFWITTPGSFESSRSFNSLRSFEWMKSFKSSTSCMLLNSFRLSRSLIHLDLMNYQYHLNHYHSYN